MSKQSRPRWRRLRLWLLVFSVLATSLGCKLVDAGADRLICPRRYDLGADMKKFVENPAAQGLELERFAVTTGDGLQLKGMIVTAGTSPQAVEGLAPFRDKLAKRDASLASKAKRPRGTVVMLHGINSRKEHMLWNARWLAAAGCRCIVYDSRGHGESGGAYATFGAKEVADLQLVIDEAVRRCGPLGPLGIFGYSMGAAIALQSLPTHPEFHRAIAVSPFAELGAVVKHQASQHYRGVLRHFLPAVRWRVSQKAGFDPWDVRPVESVTHMHCPVFFVHGGKDNVVPPDHSQRLLAACGDPRCRRKVVPAAAHSDPLSIGGDSLVIDLVQFMIEGL